MLKVILPDGSTKEFPGSVPVREVAAAIGPRLAKAAVAAEVDGKVVGLDYKLPDAGEARVKIFTMKDPEALGVMRHSAAHVMARAWPRPPWQPRSMAKWSASTPGCRPKAKPASKSSR